MSTGVKPLKLLRKNEVIELLNIGESTLNMWVRQNKIPFVKLGKSVRFRQSEIDAYLDSRTVKAKRGH